VSPYRADDYLAWQANADSSARVVVPLVRELVGPESVIDVGCGTGAWLAAFREAGIDDVVGVDGSTVDLEMLQIPRERFRVHDLEEPLELERRFDLVMSLEVAEHLPEAAAETFVASLVGLGSVILFSAAIPGQGGVHHVNEQWPDYWAERFAAHGYVPVDCVRRRIWSEDGVAWWYAQNILLFVARDELERSPRLMAEHEIAGGSQLAVVHPVKYQYLRDWAIEKSLNGSG
jgi:SAM-dependent methyltransferase